MADYADGNKARSLLETNGIELIHIPKNDVWGED